MKRLVTFAVLVLLVVFGAVEVSAEQATCDLVDEWEVPAEGAEAMFDEGGRAFFVGAASSELEPGETEELLPGPNCTFEGERCAQSRCSGVCIAYTNYYCGCYCGEFDFC